MADELTQTTRVSDLGMAGALQDNDLILLTVQRGEAFESQSISVLDLKRMLHIATQETFYSDGHFAARSMDGENGFVLDADFGAWFAGLPRPLQEYLTATMPSSEGNQYPDYHEVFLSADKKALRLTDDNGGLWLCGIDEAIQNRLDGLLSSSVSKGISGWQWLALSKNRKGLFGTDDNGGFHVPGITGPIQDLLLALSGGSGPNVKPEAGTYVLMWGDRKIWGDRPVLGTEKITDTGALLRYLPGGEATSGTGVVFHRGGREMPIEASAFRIIAFMGQSLMIASDAGNIPNPGSYNKVNRDPALRGRAITVNGGKPEFSGDADTIISDDNLDKLADMVNANYRQGQVIPLTNRLIYDCDAAGLAPSIFYSANSASGGKSFAQIWKGTVPYTNGLRLVQRGADIAAGIGKPCSVDFVLFAHGQTDNGNGTNTAPGAYASRMTQHFANVTADYTAITHQTTGPLFVIDQCGSRISTERGEVDEEGNVTDPEILFNFSISATDQWDYVKANPETALMNASEWPLNWQLSDGSLSHINNWGKVIQGEYMEQALFWHYDPAQTSPWLPTHVKSISLQGTTLITQWHTPRGGLVRDVATFGDCPNDSFSLQLASANILQVTQEGNTVSIELDAVPSTDDALLIGFTNTTPAPNGHIYPMVPFRDSSTLTSRWYKPDGVNFYPLYNWGILQRIPLEDL
ncbi:hypothetical protein [Serratia marcescens]|uniref:hypothetical protein n=1 Tax=Serratia marcescens TaxID=615 RepID=UPI002FE6BFD9